MFKGDDSDEEDGLVPVGPILVFWLLTMLKRLPEEEARIDGSQIEDIHSWQKHKVTEGD